MSEQPRARDAATMAGALLAECVATSLPLGQMAHPRKRCELAVGVRSLQGEDIRAETSPSTVPLTQGQSCAWSNYGVVLKLPEGRTPHGAERRGPGGCRGQSTDMGQPVGSGVAGFSTAAQKVLAGTPAWVRCL